QQKQSRRIVHNPYRKDGSQKARNVKKATRQYEEWLGKVSVIEKNDFKRKHQLMRQSLLLFLRSTFYRWIELFPITCPKLALAPAVISVGDLTIENFSTWRDAQHRLNWGINYFDEATNLPYTSDLVRLATSAQIAFDMSGQKAKLDH